MRACTEGRLADVEVKFAKKCSCCLVKASAGYPEKYATGSEIKVELYIAGAKLEEGRLVTSGGRVLGVTAVADTLGEAVAKAYREADKVHFDGEFFRKDIGARALAAKRG